MGSAGDRLDQFWHLYTVSQRFWAVSGWRTEQAISKTSQAGSKTS